MFSADIYNSLLFFIDHAFGVHLGAYSNATWIHLMYSKLRSLKSILEPTSFVELPKRVKIKTNGIKYYDYASVRRLF